MKTLMIVLVVLFLACSLHAQDTTDTTVVIDSVMPKIAGPVPGAINLKKTDFVDLEKVWVFSEDALGCAIGDGETSRDENGYILPHLFKAADGRGTIIKDSEYDEESKKMVDIWRVKTPWGGFLKVTRMVPEQDVVFYYL